MVEGRGRMCPWPITESGSLDEVWQNWERRLSLLARSEARFPEKQNQGHPKAQLALGSRNPGWLECRKERRGQERQTPWGRPQGPDGSGGCLRAPASLRPLTGQVCPEDVTP